MAFRLLVGNQFCLQSKFGYTITTTIFSGSRREQGHVHDLIVPYST